MAFAMVYDHTLDPDQIVSQFNYAMDNIQNVLDCPRSQPAEQFHLARMNDMIRSLGIAQLNMMRVLIDELRKRKKSDEKS